ncbi:hypothetical protein ACFE04_013059 [Oxalis oulophora]
MVWSSSCSSRLEVFELREKDLGLDAGRIWVWRLFNEDDKWTFLLEEPKKLISYRYSPMKQQSKAFDKLTDHVEDRQLDSSRVQTAMASIAASKEADMAAMRLRDKELAAVTINAADIDIIANELELDKKLAERTLREHKGDAVAAIRHLLC